MSYKITYTSALIFSQLLCNTSIFASDDAFEKREVTRINALVEKCYFPAEKTPNYFSFSDLESLCAELAKLEKTCLDVTSSSYRNIKKLHELASLLKS